MTRDQLDGIMAGMSKEAPYSQAQIFYIPGTYLRFIRAILMRVAIPLAGQPNLSIPEDFPTPTEILQFLKLLSSPTNGYKLFLPLVAMRLVTATIRRVVRRIANERQPFFFDANDNLIYVGS